MLLLWVVLFASVAAWSSFHREAQQNGEPIAFEPRPALPWGFRGLAIATILYLACQAVAVGLVLGLRDEQAAEASEAEKIIPAMITSAVANGLTLLVVPLALWLFERARLRDLGFNLSRLAYDVPLGIRAFFALVVPIYALQAALHFLLEEVLPGEHPLQTLLAERRDLGVATLAVVSAGILAPIVEELLFRGILQGTLESLFQRRSYVVEADDDELLESTEEPEAWEDVSENAGWDRSGWIAIVLSSLIFAGLHWGHGTAPVALFFLSLGLGYLYRQTHRLLPCIVVHALLNLSSLAALLVAPPPS